MKHRDICILLVKCFLIHDWKLSLAMTRSGVLELMQEEIFWSVYNAFQDPAYRAAFVVHVYLWLIYQYFSFYFREALFKYL